MTTSPARRLAAGPSVVLLVCVLFAVATPTLATFVVEHRTESGGGAVSLGVIAASLIWAVVGSLVASRLPGSPIGWLFLAVGVAATTGLFLGLYAAATMQGGAPLPGHRYTAWGASLLLQSPAIFGLLALVLLLFPDGQPLSSRWRRLVTALWWSVGTYTLVLAVRPGEIIETSPAIDNPFGFALADPVWVFVGPVLGSGFMLAMLAGLVSVGVRFRRARGIERQQLKWLATGAGGLVLVMLSGPTVFWPNERLDAAWPIVFVAGLMLLPTTAGVAILRYRLYEIERIVSRTLSYLIVAGLLGAAYVGLTLSLQRVAHPLLGDGKLPVAVSTLLAAAAFRPLHRRVRTLVDRRFNRRRFDAEQAMAAFGLRIRDELDVSSLGCAIEDLVASTLEPSFQHVWMVPQSVIGTNEASSSSRLA